MNGKGPVLIIDNFDSFTRNLSQSAEEEGAGEIEIIREDALVPKDAGRFRKILISPGPGLPSDFPRMMEVIRLFAGKCSILGICLGHQAIAVTFGAKLRRMEQVRHGIPGEMEILEPADPLFSGVPGRISVGLYHSWEVDPQHVPQQIRITAISPGGTILAIRHSQYNLTGFQFHPESFMTTWGRRLIRNWLAGEE